MRRQRRLGALLLALLLVVASTPVAPGARAATADYVTNCPVNVRASASLTASVLDTLSSGTIVTASDTVTGDAWSTTCVSAVSGNTWYAITAIGGATTSKLYGVPAVYAATGLFSTSPLASDLEGVDVSNWQGAVDFSQVKASGRSFVIAKATEGIGYADKYWPANKANARAAGLAVGAYHFARPDLDPTNAAGEADWFVDTMGLEAGMIVPALDLEVPGSLSVADLTTWVQTFLDRVYQRTGARAMIYASPAFWRKYLGDTRWFADNGYQVLWVAHWTSGTAPSVPGSNWGGHGWTFWQYTSSGSVPGITGSVDLDRYNGTDLTPVTYNPDFALAPASAALSVKQGASASTSISITRSFFSMPLPLTVSGLPAGATATLSPNPATGDSSTLTITTSATGTVTPVGSYAITVGGSGAGISRSTSLSLTVTDGIPPAVTAPRTGLLAITTLWATLPVIVSWSAADPSGVASMQLQQSVNGGAWSQVALASAATRSIAAWVSPGVSYRFATQATDGAGNAGAWQYGVAVRPLITQQTSGVSYSSRWYTQYSRYTSGGSLRYTTTRGAWASFRFSGRSIAWVAYRGPNRGSAAVYIDGVYRGTVSLYASTYRARQIVFEADWPNARTHTIKVVCLGTYRRPRIDLDAFIRLVNG